MKPFVWGRGRHWFVGYDRDDLAETFPGTSPIGYPSQREAFRAAIVAITLAPS